MIQKIEGQDHYEIVTYRDAISKDTGSTIEIENNRQRITMENIDSSLLYASGNYVYWKGIKAEAGNL